jgi:hypothetical protein
MAMNIKPLEAFQYLLEKNLPLILSFPLEEEKGYFITGMGICYVEKIHGSSRVTFGKFSPFKTLDAIRSSQYFYANFEIKGTTYGCILEDIMVDRAAVVASVPVSLSAFLRKFLRVEPSFKLPVNIHMTIAMYGTLSLPVRDISEHGVGFTSEAPLDVGQELICGIELPLEGKTFILSRFSIAYKKELEQKTPQTGRKGRSGYGNAPSGKYNRGVSYGFELFPHNEDEKKLRLYIRQREVEIRKKIQEQW